MCYYTVSWIADESATRSHHVNDEKTHGEAVAEANAEPDVQVYSERISAEVPHLRAFVSPIDGAHCAKHGADADADVVSNWPADFASVVAPHGESRGPRC